MLRKTTFLFAAALMFTTAACDTDSEPVEDRAAEPTDAPTEVGAKLDQHGKHGKHGKFNPAEKLCADLECSDAQAAQIDELFASRHQGFDEADHEARKAARAEAHKAIADAFRAEEFDVGVLDRIAGDHERDGVDHEAKMIEFATELHAILTPEQRAKLADEIAAGGSMFFAHRGKGHHGKKRHGKKAHHKKDFEAADGEGKKHDPAERLAHEVDRFCEPISCTAEQQTQLTAAFEAAHEAKREAKAERRASKPDLAPLADAFRADTLDQAKLRAVMAERKDAKADRKADHAKQFGGMIAEIHDILTPEQRAIVADKIEAEGLHSIMGKGRHGKKRHGKKRRGGAEVGAK